MAHKQKDSGLASIGAVLGRRWDVGLFAFAVTAAVACGLAAFLPGLYRSRAVVLVEPPLLPGLQEEDVQTRVDALTQEAMSRSQLEAIIARHQLQGTAHPEAAVLQLRRDVTIAPTKSSDPGQPLTTAITVSYIGRDARKVAAVTDDFARFYVDTEKNRLKQRLETMRLQLEDLGKRLDEGEARVAQLLVTAVEDVLDQASQPGAAGARSGRRNPLGALPEQLESHVLAMEDLQGQLQDLRENRQAAIARRSVLAQRPPPAAPGADEPPRPRTVAERSEEARRLDAELARQEETLRELRGRFTEQHPDVLMAKRRVKQLERQAAEAGRKPVASAPPAAPRLPRATQAPAAGRVDLGTQVRGVDAQLGVLSKEERELADRIKSVKESATEAPKRAQELASLLTRFEAPRAAYDALLRRYEELRMAHGADAERVPFRVVEQAIVARSPEAPDRLRLLMVGLALAFLVAAAAIALAEQVDGSFHSARDLNAFTRLPILTRIPHISTSQGSRRQRLRAFRRVFVGALAVVAALLGTGALAHENDTVAHMLVRRTPQ